MVNTMDGKDYYQMLGVREEASDQDIKKAYRRLALKYHPDRNSGDKAAEERFKAISEAYGVLIDREKRRQYDQLRRVGPQGRFGDQAFRYTQEDIFRDVFRNPNASDIFRDLRREFDKFGLRFDERFFKEVFFGSRGFFFGGFFFGGPLGSRTTFRSGKTFDNLFDRGDGRVGHFRSAKPPVREGVIRKVGRKVGKYLLDRRVGGKENYKLPKFQGKDANLYHSLSVTPEEAASGTTVNISYRREGKKEKLAVRIPAGIQPGKKLRLKGKGLDSKGGDPPGDLFLHIKVKKDK
ncbi:MAG: DnaJ domain-containing protein [Pseudomonadota bacterium]